MNPRGFGWIWVKKSESCGLVWGVGYEMRVMYVLMDNGLDSGNIFSRKKKKRFGFGFSVMERVVFGSEILPREGLYPD